MSMRAASRDALKKEALLTRSFVMAALINLCMFMGWQMTATGLPVYLSSLGGTEPEVGLVTALAVAAAVLLRPFVGMLVDRFGRTGFLVGGLALMACATVAYAVFPFVGVVLGLRLLHGFGWGLSSTSSSTIAADIIPKRRFAEGMGYFAMTNAAAMALAPALAIQLLYSGDAAYMLMVAGGFTLLAVVIGIAFFLTSYEQPALKAEKLDRGTFALGALFERRALFPSLTMLLMCMGFGAITTLIAIVGASRGIGNMSFYFLVYAITTFFTRPPIGRAIDRFGFFVPGVLSCICFAASLAVIAWADSIASFCAAGVLVGLGLGTAMGVFQTMAVSAVAPQRRGVATSTYFFFFDCGIGLGAFVAGFLAQAWGYEFMYLAMAAVALLAGVLFAAGGRARSDG